MILKVVHWYTLHADGLRTVHLPESVFLTAVSCVFHHSVHHHRNAVHSLLFFFIEEKENRSESRNTFLQEGSSASFSFSLFWRWKWCCSLFFHTVVNPSLFIPPFWLLFDRISSAPQRIFSYILSPLIPCPDTWSNDSYINDDESCSLKGGHKTSETTTSLFFTFSHQRNNHRMKGGSGAANWLVFHWHLMLSFPSVTMLIVQSFRVWNSLQVPPDQTTIKVSSRLAMIMESQWSTPTFDSFIINLLDRWSAGFRDQILLLLKDISRGRERGSARSSKQWTRLHIHNTTNTSITFDVGNTEGTRNIIPLLNWSALMQETVWWGR